MPVPEQSCFSGTSRKKVNTDSGSFFHLTACGLPVPSLRALSASFPICPLHTFSACRSAVCLPAELQTRCCFIPPLCASLPRLGARRLHPLADQLRSRWRIRGAGRLLYEPYPQQPWWSRAKGGRKLGFQMLRYSKLGCRGRSKP